MKDGIDPVLVVDLDGTLLQSDLLHESFWSAFGRDWRSPLTAIAALFAGRSSLKQHLALGCKLDAATLPYDTGVIAYVEAWRSKGGRTALVTASDEAFAAQVAEHLDLFDEVFGSDSGLNLKGSAKADFLADHFCADGYIYMGDARADLPVWHRAHKAITVNASQSLKFQAEQIAGNIEHLKTKNQTLLPYFKALRPHQWIKNSLVFLPMIAAHRFDGTTALHSIVAFLSFSLIASSVYVVNDLLDLASDRSHPRKRHRPFASGSVPIAHGSWMALGLLAIGTGVSATLGWQFLLVMLTYYVLTSAYSLCLKRLIVIDIFVLAALYTLRIFAGGIATGIDLSMWLLGFSTFFFFSLAAVKRQAELVDSAQRGKLTANGRGYQVADVPIVSMIALGSGYVSVLVLALYLNSPFVREIYAHPHALAGICGILLYWVTYMVLVTHRGSMHDDPLVFAANDRSSRVCFILITALGVAGTIL